MLDEEEKPKDSTVNYVIEAVAQVEEKKTTDLAGDISIVYCIDISGSMSARK